MTAVIISKHIIAMYYPIDITLSVKIPIFTHYP